MAYLHATVYLLLMKQEMKNKGWMLDLIEEDRVIAPNQTHIYFRNAEGLEISGNVSRFTSGGALRISKFQGFNLYLIQQTTGKQRSIIVKESGFDAFDTLRSIPKMSRGTMFFSFPNLNLISFLREYSSKRYTIYLFKVSHEFRLELSATFQLLRESQPRYFQFRNNYFLAQYEVSNNIKRRTTIYVDFYQLFNGIYSIDRSKTKSKAGTFKPK